MINSESKQSKTRWIYTLLCVTSLESGIETLYLLRKEQRKKQTSYPQKGLIVLQKECRADALSIMGEKISACKQLSSCLVCLPSHTDCHGLQAGILYTCVFETQMRNKEDKRTKKEEHSKNITAQRPLTSIKSKTIMILILLKTQ